MQLQPKITFLEFPPSEAVETDILGKIEKLEQFYPNVTGCEVVVRQEQKSSHQGKLYNPRITLSVPGEKLNVNHAANEDVYVAIRDAFNALQRQLKEYSHRRRGDVKHHDLTIRGQIARVFYEEGFGFIEANDEEFYFDDFSVGNIDFERLRSGMAVDFIVNDNGDSPQAKRVTLVKSRNSE